MTTVRMQPEDIGGVAAEIAALRNDVYMLRREVLAALRSVTSALSEISDKKDLESQARYCLVHLQSRLDHLTATRQPDRLHCHVCGAPTVRHAAEAGELVCCGSCGWSEFITFDGAELSASSPECPPCSPAPPAWTA
jgi:hypothetical protein